MTREGAGAEERDWLTAEERIEATCRSMSRHEKAPGVGGCGYCVPLRMLYRAASSAATAKERKRLHALLERCYNAVDPDKRPAVHDALVKELNSRGDGQDGAPQETK